jgi:hypothetical protein
MYHIEVTLKKLGAMVGNKARVECCITKEFKVKEIAYVTSVYFVEYHNVNAYTMQYRVDEDVPCSDIQNFQWRGMTVGASTTYHPTQKEHMSALLYMYSNMDEMKQYFDSRYLTSHRQPMTKQLDNLRWEGINGGPNFLTWFREHVNLDLLYIYYSALLSLII